MQPLKQLDACIKYLWLWWPIGFSGELAGLHGTESDQCHSMKGCNGNRSGVESKEPVKQFASSRFGQLTCYPYTPPTNAFLHPFPSISPISLLKTMMKLNEIHRTVTFVWSPSPFDPLLTTGTVADSLDASFSNNRELDTWAPDIMDRSEYDMWRRS